MSSITTTLMKLMPARGPEGVACLSKPNPAQILVASIIAAALCGVAYDVWGKPVSESGYLAAPRVRERAFLSAEPNEHTARLWQSWPGKRPVPVVTSDTSGLIWIQSTPGDLSEAERKADEMIRTLENKIEADKQQQASTNREVLPSDLSGPKVSLVELLFRGGALMIPIGFMSLLVVACALERALGLRRSKVLPPGLLRQLAALGARPEGFDPRLAYRLCQLYPSAASNVIRATLLKVGRPQVEVEQALRDAEEREASRLYSNVRWLSLAAGVTPLLGLLGTVWGMIKAFFVTANLPLGVNRATLLADGIYVALVTTFAGLSVAIPAAVLAHLFEGRIQKLFREIDELMLGILPQLERFEGRLRFFGDGFVDEYAAGTFAPPHSSTLPPPPPPVASASRRRADSAPLSARPAEAPPKLEL